MFAIIRIVPVDSTSARVIDVTRCRHVSWIQLKPLNFDIPEPRLCACCSVGLLASRRAWKGLAIQRCSKNDFASNIFSALLDLHPFSPSHRPLRHHFFLLSLSFQHSFSVLISTR